MKLKITARLVAMAIAGGVSADVIFTTDGFESPTYTVGTVAGKNVGGSKVWVEWDGINSVNNANPDFTVVQSSVAKNGSQALAIADVTNRVIARIVNLNVTQAVTYWDAWYKTEAANDLGQAAIVFRTDAGNKQFTYNTSGGQPKWFDSVNIGNNVVSAWGEWARVTIQIDLSADTYVFYLNEAVAFSGALGFNASQINSWEVDVIANDANRSPKGPYAFYVDDLQITTAMIPEPATLGLFCVSSGLLMMWRRRMNRG